jgi:hypothetical protein
VLNSELKYLYTALTRARVNIWIYDEDEEAAAPMSDYFKVLKLVTVIRPSDISGGGGAYNRPLLTIVEVIQ